ncbi:MAG: 1-acyl-sn-glycerol-3-phosphate acyltransferase [Chloroflexi bacterium]|nr:1-acyl-sn-glycerol-3-phosphate acyltransferase [Chloroflexota bacterium]
MPLSYWAWTSLMRSYLLLLSRWRVVGQENVPRKGPLIIAANHFSFIDPPLISASVPRRIAFLAKQELFRFLPLRLMVRSFGAIAVRRGRSSRHALERSERILAQGKALGIFPENRRNRQGQLQHPQRGVALLALRNSAPILPIAITGSEKVQSFWDIFRRPTITVTIGHPFYLQPNMEETDSDLQAQAEVVMEHIAQLLPEIYRGPFGKASPLATPASALKEM